MRPPAVPEQPVPILTDDQAVGVINFSFPNVLDFDADLQQFMVTSAALTAQALERARTLKVLV